MMNLQGRAMAMFVGSAGSELPMCATLALVRLKCAIKNH